jgi:hypothetical protein
VNPEDRLPGIDGPRPLPADLDAQLQALLAPGDPVAALTERPAPLPDDLRDRLVAGLAAGAGTGAGMPRDVRRRIVRVLAGPPATAPRVLRVAAVVVPVLLVAGSLAFAAARDGGDRAPTDLAVEPSDADHDGGAGVDRLPGPGEDDLAGEPGAPGDVTATDPGLPAGGGGGGGGPTPAPTARRRAVPPPAGEGLLVAYASCDDLLGRTKAAALEVVGPYGLGGAAVADGFRRDEATAGPAPAAAPAPGGAEVAGVVEHSTTNVQEAGVDEPDVVKSDGRRIVTLTGRTLRIIRIDGGPLRQVGALDLPEGATGGELLVDGDRAVVLGWTMASSNGAASSSRAMPWSPPQATIWTVDLADQAAPWIRSTLVLDGSIATARLVDGKVRLALTSTTLGPDWVTPSDSSQEASNRALEENRRLVRDSSLDDWLPSYTLLQGTDPGTARRGRLCACDDTLRPEASFAGASTMSVLTLDPHRPDQPPLGSAAVQGWAETVYASRGNLYATTRAFTAQGLSPTSPTTIHRFDISGPAATYRGSGEVRGTPLNQFSLSERAGHLRVATTDHATGDGGESFVTVLAVRDDRLEPVGSVGGLGKGERIYAVRFLDAVGYVVTFRQTDPLYTVDLSDPTKPRLRGELKIPGFSSYLHPIDDGRLLGVGQDATDTGRPTGAQVSSFDVRDLDRPSEVQRIGYGTGSSTEAQHDHHAFLWWAASRRAMVPVQRSEREGDTYRSRSWLSVVEVGGDGRMREAGTVTHDGRGPSDAVIRRSFVAGRVLYTLSASGILASDLDTLADGGWLAF